MAEINGQTERIDSLIRICLNDRNFILENIIDDPKVLRVFLEYKKIMKKCFDESEEGKVIEICYNTGLKYNEVREAMNIIDNLSKKVDSVQSKIMRQKHIEKVKNKKDIPESLSDRKKTNYREELDQFYYQYNKFRAGKSFLKKSDFKYAIPKMKKRAEYLGYTTMDILALAEIYSFVGEYEKRDVILKKCKKIELFDDEKQMYEQAKTEITKEENDNDKDNDESPER